MVFIQILQNWNVFYTAEVSQNASTIEQEEFRVKVRKVSGTDKLDGGLPYSLTNSFSAYSYENTDFHGRRSNMF